MQIIQRKKHTITLIHKGKTVTYKHAGIGFEYLEELFHHPDQPITSSHLRQLFQIDPNTSGQDEFREVIPETALDCPNFPFLPPAIPIEVADPQTIDDVKQRLIYLINEEAELMQYHDLARLEDVRDEKQALIDYLKRAQSPIQKPRYLYHQQRNDYSAVKQAIQRAIAKLKPDFPELYQDLTTHLEYGLSVCYKIVA